MPAFAALEASQRLPELLDRVARGEEVLITRGGKPVARLAPVAEAQVPEPEALVRLRALRQRLIREGVSFTPGDVIALRDEGRR